MIGTMNFSPVTSRVYREPSLHPCVSLGGDCGTRRKRDKDVRFESKFDGFLLSPIGDNKNGMLLSVL